MSLRTIFHPSKKVLSIFFTAGYPRLESTTDVLAALQGAGVDMVEVGFPFSDPLADGPTIQKSSEAALRNGMNLSVLFDQLRCAKEKITIPLLLMGYLNPVLQFGIEKFLQSCKEVGVRGTIIPDMPLGTFEREYKASYERHGIDPVFLITSRTEPERIRAIDAMTDSFIYVVSSDATTGGSLRHSTETDSFLRRLEEMKLRNPLVVGFGVRDSETYNGAVRHTHGAIIGSAFIRLLEEEPTANGPVLKERVKQFVSEIREVA